MYDRSKMGDAHSFWFGSMTIHSITRPVKPLSSSCCIVGLLVLELSYALAIPLVTGCMTSVKRTEVIVVLCNKNDKFTGFYAYFQAVLHARVVKISHVIELRDRCT